MIDAGSSHTSLKVYRWPGDKKNDTGVVKQHKHTCHSDGMYTLYYFWSTGLVFVDVHHNLLCAL